MRTGVCSACGSYSDRAAAQCAHFWWPCVAQRLWSNPLPLHECGRLCFSSLQLQPTSSSSPAEQQRPFSPTPILLRRRCGDGPAVVAADEQHGGLERRGKVERCVRVPLGCCTLAKVGDRHSGRARQLEEKRGRSGWMEGHGTTQGIDQRSGEAAAKNPKRR
jgi:hypothetical protein